MNNDILDIEARGVQIRLSASNNRLRVWAERFEEIEPELLDVIDGILEGSVFYDIGASIGIFSLYAALKRRCKVIAFEAEAQNYATLELNHYLNHDRLSEPLTALNIAIADTFSIGKIYTRTYGAGEHCKILDRSITQDTKEEFIAAHVQSVIKMPLDQIIFNLGLPAPEVIKIDVDGAEGAVLAGSQAMFGEANLHTVFIELSEISGDMEATTLINHGFKLTKKVPVARLRGGVYPGLFNHVYKR